MKKFKKATIVLSIALFTASFLVNLTGCSNDAPFQPKFNQESNGSGQLAKFTPGFFVQDTTKTTTNDSTAVKYPKAPESNTNSRYGVGTE